MSAVDVHPAHSFARRTPPPRVIIAHGDSVRSFVVRPWLVGTLAVIGAIFSLLYFAATGYLVFRDDLLAASLAHQSRMQTGYEDRIATLRADIDRLTSRQLLNQKAVEDQVDKLLGRQSALDTRQDILDELSAAMHQAGLAPGDSDGAAAPPAKAADTSDEAKLTTGSLLPSDGAKAVIGKGGDAMARLKTVAASLDRLSQEQVAYVDSVARSVTSRTKKITAALKRIDQSVPSDRANEDDGVGGPFVGIDENADPETFRANVALIKTEIDRLDNVRRFAEALPLAAPLPGAVVTSPFGTRIDPFLGEPAMHTGVDFRARRGLAIPATAAGKVVSAGRNGGYGNMVEIDHGNGVSTRYAHLSKIEVKVGQVVGKGTIVGKAGSTGRSTAPHLHYEVRVEGKPLNPLTYIAAGDKILPLL
jgi:murein DD-endopeptidase MepM/ murein hydrolase activator NlpD